MGERVENPSLVICSLFRDEDAWIHETVGVEGLLDGTKQRDAAVTDLRPQPFSPDAADAVVVRDAAAALDRGAHHAPPALEVRRFHVAPLLRPGDEREVQIQAGAI